MLAAASAADRRAGGGGNHGRQSAHRRYRTRHRRPQGAPSLIHPLAAARLWPPLPRGPCAMKSDFGSSASTVHAWNHPRLAFTRSRELCFNNGPKPCLSAQAARGPGQQSRANPPSASTAPCRNRASPPAALHGFLYCPQAPSLPLLAATELRHCSLLPTPSRRPGPTT